MEDAARISSGTYINIPSLMEGRSWDPSDDAKPWDIGVAVRKWLHSFLDVPYSHTGKKSGYDHSGKFT